MQYLSAPVFGPDFILVSALHKGLRDSRYSTNRNLDTGDKTEEQEHGSWVGLLGYLCVLDHIGTCFRRRDRPARSEATNSLVYALQSFTSLSSHEIAAVYALRCAFAHDFSLFNVHTKPELTHYFRLFAETDQPMIQLPARGWSGDHNDRPSECWTAIGLTLLCDLVESICSDLRSLAERGEIEVSLVGGPAELQSRYMVMKRFAAGTTPRY